MKKLVFYVIIFASIFILFTKCAVGLKEIDQKAIKSCSVCIDFLSDKKIYEATYRAYDRSNFQGDIIPLTERLDSVKTLYKATFIDNREVQYIASHSFCFVGMKKSEVEFRFGKSLGKSSGPSFNVCAQRMPYCIASIEYLNLHKKDEIHRRRKEGVC